MQKPTEPKPAPAAHASKPAAKPVPDIQIPSVKLPANPIITGLLLFLLIAGCAVAVIFFALSNKSLTINFNTPSPTSEKPATAKRIYQDIEIGLSGVMMMDDHQVALINGEIYSVGESINGKEIISITIDQVEFRDANGKVIWLKP